MPTDANAAYQSRLQWNEVTDSARSAPGTSTNRGGEGMETKASQGKAIFEKEFAGDFASELPWHKYPAVASLSDDDKQKLIALIKERADAFKPKFDSIYQILGTRPEVQAS